MTLTLLDLYNTAAAQEWSMYDNDAASEDEFEDALVLSLNKAIAEILYSYPFNFRERSETIIILPKIISYGIPPGVIKQTESGEYCIRLGRKYLKPLKDLPDKTCGIPEAFYIGNGEILFYPAPIAKHRITITYLTLAIGENSDGEGIFSLQNEDDILYVPEHLEELLKNAVISRAMLNSIASESDENYSAYKKQSETSYRMLIKYSKGVAAEKKIRF